MKNAIKIKLMTEQSICVYIGSYSKKQINYYNSTNFTEIW